MSYWRTLPGMVVLIVLLGLGAGCGVVVAQVWNVTHPPRVAEASASIALDLAGVDQVAFKSADGLDLAAWLFHGQEGRPAVVLAHDAGSSKGSLVNLAIALQKKGLTVVAFDFRGHGGSGAGVSTLGIAEKRDVLGAVDYVSSLAGVDHRRVGIYGVGMGAHAAVLAAADRPGVRVLVLDALYPDAAYPLVRRAYEGWGFGVRHLGFAPTLAMRAVAGVSVGGARAADVLPSLQGRDVLIVAPESNPALSAVLKTLFESLPQRRDAESNLISAPASAPGSPAGEVATRRYGRVTDFLETRLSRS